MTENVQFHDLPWKTYPFKIRARRVESKEIVWEETVSEPGALIVPPSDGQGLVYVEIMDADGKRRSVSYPDKAEKERYAREFEGE